MQLTPAQVKRALSQFDAEAVPTDHPALPQLTRLFGDHTFFLDRSGLNIVEPTDAETDAEAATGAHACQVINLASWNDGDPPVLEPHEPTPTDIVIQFETMH